MTADGVGITARLFHPEGKAKGSVLIVPAMGCSQEYYLAVALCGYFPGKALRKVGDLPKGVIQQWRRWCLDREYAVGAEGDAVRAQYAAVRTPIVSLSFADDEMMSARNTDSIHGFYASAPRKMKRIAPQVRLRGFALARASSA